MGINKNSSFSLPQALGVLDAVAQRIQNTEEDVLITYGEEFCEVARATKTYQDVTGRLSASIGYGLVLNGTIVRTGGFLGGEGEEEGMVALQKAAFDVSSDTLTLVLVAGMHYALYVERKGYSVLDGARFSAEEILSRLHLQIAA